jgi:hypothetical protein
MVSALTLTNSIARLNNPRCETLMPFRLSSVDTARLFDWFMLPPPVKMIFGVDLKTDSALILFP